MKQLLPLFLALLPCLAWAQYPSNGNQKITLGEQTTADGLFYRGLAADTTRKPSVDTMAYMLLDTATNIMWHYKKATSNAWLRLNLLPSDTTSLAYVNTYGTQTVNGAKTFSSTVTGARFDPTSSIASGNGMFLPAANTLGFSTNGTQNMTLDASGRLGVGVINPNDLLTVYGTGGSNPNAIIKVQGTTNYATFLAKNTSGNFYFGIDNVTGTGFNNGAYSRVLYSDGVYPIDFYTNDVIKMRITSGGNVGIGTISPQSGYRLHVVDSVYVGGNVSAAAYTTRSDYNLKDDIFDLKYGLNDVLQLQPVEYTYKSNGSKQLGFIAQDIGTILPEVVSFEESMSVNYQAIIPILTKAIQEQQALIKTLEQRIINLENK